MTLAIGTVRRPRRVYPRKRSAFTWATSVGSGGILQRFRRYRFDELVDIAGVKSGCARVVAALNDGAAVTSDWPTWDADTSTERDVRVTGQIVYSCEVWDIDAGAFVTRSYPESELEALATYEAWIESGSAADPTNVLPRVTARHVDLASPPAEVASLARAVAIGGG